MNKKLVWYIKAQIGVLLFPAGLCLFGQAVTNRIAGDPWFWLGTASLVAINAGIGLMIDSGLLAGFPKDDESKD